MVEASRRLTLDHPAIYRIEVQGELDQSWSSWFDQMTLTCDGGQTTLMGLVTDQPQLYGLLLKLRDLGLPLISVHCIQPDADSDG